MANNIVRMLFDLDDYEKGRVNAGQVKVSSKTKIKVIGVHDYDVWDHGEPDAYPVKDAAFESLGYYKKFVEFPQGYENDFTDCYIITGKLGSLRFPEENSYGHLSKDLTFFAVVSGENVQIGGVTSLLSAMLVALRKELHMAIKKIKFQLKDWDEENPDYPSYIGKTVIPPKKIFYYLINERGVFEKAETTEQPPRGVVIGQYRQGQIYLTTEPTSFNLWFRLHDLIEYGGVSSSPLTHLYQSLRHLLNRKVALVND